MNILVLNGSPRLKGNTRLALTEIIKGINENLKDEKVEVIDVNTKELSACINCDVCKSNGGNCVMPDDSAEILNEIYNADTIILGTPVYWWGISAQLKMVIDKFYSKTSELSKQNKKLGIVSVGASEITDKQYELISEQFKCICNYLGWKIVFDKPISAYAAGDVLKDKNTMQELKMLWKNL